jgi:hypothetical protein
MKKNTTPAVNFWSQKNNWLAILLAIFVTFCLYFYIQSPSALDNLNPFSLVFIVGTFSIAPLAMILTTIFGGFYIYKTVKRDSIHKIALVIGWLFVSLALFSVLFIWAGGDRGCSGFMGEQTTCADANFVSVVLLFLNPFTQMLWSVLAAVGLIGLTVRVGR